MIEMNSLASDIIYEIFNNLNDYEILNLCQTSQATLLFYQDDNLWRLLYTKKFDVQLFEGSWFEQYYKTTALQKINDLFFKSKQLSLLDFYQTTLLRITDAELNKIPSGIFFLPHLTSLDLSHNQIKIIPKEIKKLKKLNHLNLSHNQIEIIPKEVEELKKLNRLGLSNNQIDNLTICVENMRNLQYLYLEQNKILKRPRVKCVIRIVI